MENKRYSSYAQIKCELEILKVEKELNLQKIVLSVQKTKESLLPVNMIKGILGEYKSILSNSSGMILKMAVPLIVNWFTKRKRGF
jgi:uncharacterized membrane protein